MPHHPSADQIIDLYNRHADTWNERNRPNYTALPLRP
jgi:hypothetical protein